ncbi:IS110 family transposase [Paraglaciecola aquimarina]|uniref:IS110 family transposase n=1 Tax=Paraglaciecola algarum TaxID=3050085 RepID=A0ABS9D273_9ALTE|nr:IS110 family transposase [Paraglaciecola sp. G1-23]MCF2946840.1 IS110 family transposase [Paraglaciecola sp. G1-23]
MNITTIGLDIAKRVFHVTCCSEQGKLVRKKMLKRVDVLAFFRTIPSCTVALEACVTAHYWAREIEMCGHTVKLIAPQHVKAFLVGNKNDYNDALSIATAVRQHHVSHVSVNTIEQQDNQALHKARELAVRQRTSLCNQIRGLVSEYGMCINQGVNTLRKRIPIWLSDETHQLSESFKQLLTHLKHQLNELDANIETFNQMIATRVKENDVCQRLQTIPGIGPMVASAYFNEVGNGAGYRKGRDVSASLGLVPKQHSSGGKQVLLGISKRGNSYLRCLLVQGAKAVVSRAKKKEDTLSNWINHLVHTRGHNRACIAYANKMARMAWAISVKESEYRPLKS